MRWPGWLRSVLAAPLLVAAGCSPPEVQTRVVLPPSTTEQQIGGLRATPELQRLVEELSRDASHGIVDGFSDAESKQRLHDVIAAITRGLLDEIGRSVHGPATRDAAAGMTRSVLRSFSDELTASVGPAMRQVIVDDLLRNPELRSALNDTAQDIGKQVALGSTRGVAAGARMEQPFAANLVPTMVWLVILVVVALALGIPLAIVMRLRRAEQRYREETERRTAVAAALLEAAQSEHQDPALKRLFSQLTAALTARGVTPAREAPPEPPPRGTSTTLRPA